LYERNAGEMEQLEKECWSISHKEDLGVFSFGKRL